ncbi:unnamed protein product [Protopolystoma xenopodis]|uniref:Uncharacterized protein n=1 Tax=Protopolystoma xenopodis TaxID=117903 RepID=A0A448XP94_9PLAT|nr:unnamed protein product [Protopolystoma xenopodis]
MRTAETRCTAAGWLLCDIHVDAVQRTSSFVSGENVLSFGSSINESLLHALSYEMKVPLTIGDWNGFVIGLHRKLTVDSIDAVTVQLATKFSASFCPSCNGHRQDRI